MSTNRKIQKVLVALIVGMLCAAPVWGFAQAEKGVTRAGESTKASPVKPYVNEFGKLVCWPRVNSNGKLLTYGPIADTEDADEITATTAKLHGNILHDGWCNPAGVTEQGFEISTSADFTTIVKTVTLSPTPTFTPCATYPNCTCENNKYSQTVTELLPGTTYYYRAYATNDCGTGYGDTVQFKTDDDYEVVVTGPEEYVFCITGSETATYTATTDPVISSGTKTYKWYVDGTLINGATSSTYTHTYTQADAGEHTVKCEISVVGLTREGSTGTLITVLNPTVNYTDITGETNICYGGNTELTANATASTGATLSYQWKKNGSVIPDATASSYTTENLTSNATYTCEIIATQDDCPSAASSKTVTVTVNHPVVESATIAPESTEVCAGNSFTLTANATASTGATLSYQWKKDGDEILDATSATYTTTLTSPLTYFYTCVVTATLNGCSSELAEASATVSVLPPASVGTITLNDEPICDGSSTTLIPTFSGSEGTLSYLWSTGEKTATISVSPTSTTTYTVTVTASNGACSATGSKTVTVTVLKPTVNFTGITGPESICSGNSVTLTADATASSGAELHYQWSYNNHEIDGANSATYTISTISGTGYRTYKCRVEAIDGYECTSGDVEKEFTFNIYNPSVSNTYITPNTPTTICAGSSTTLTAHANVNPTAATVSYQWKKNGADISGATSATYNATEAGEYTCVITATQGSCSKSATPNAATVAVSTPSVGTIALAGQTICGGNTATLTPTISGSEGTLSYQWSTGGNPIPDATSASYTTPELTSTTTYTFSVTATVGTCTDTKNVSATVTVDGPYETEETLEICDCQLPFTFTIGECTFVWTKDAGENNYLTNPTRTCTLKTVKNQCDSIVHITLLTWSAAYTEDTPCHNILNPNIREQNGMDGTDLYTIKDIDGNEYAVVQIGDQCWMKENLRVKKFDDGRANPDLSPVSDVDVHGNRADIYYVPSSNKVFTKNVCDQSIEIPYNSDYEKQYGLYYNWYTAMGTNNPAYDMHNVQGICPQGWHLPDTAEWQTLERAAGFYGQHSEINHVFVGQSAIHLVTGCEWKQSTVANSPGDYTAFGRNDLNFSARPAGCFLDADHPGVDGSNYYKNTVAYTGIWTFFWSSTRFHKWKDDGSALDPAYDDAKAAYNYDITFNLPGIARDVNGRDYLIGRSVRCVRDVSSMKVRIDSKAANADGTAYVVTGNVYDLGSTNCVERGVCYATHTYPSISDDTVIATGTPGLGAYTCNVPVTSGVKYYVRAYAIDAAGNVVYSNEVNVPDVCPSATVQDGNGNSYTTVAIGSQCWTTHSLHATKYADGTELTLGSPTTGNLYSSTVGYYYTPYPSNAPTGDAADRIQIWGYMYNWAAATRGVSGDNVQGICPNGWHIPSMADWNTLDNYVKSTYGCNGGSAQAMSSINTWTSTGTSTCMPGYDAAHTNNKSGFNAYPAGYYNATGYTDVANSVRFWASDNNYYTRLVYNNKDFLSNNTATNLQTNYAFSVRCVKN